MKYLTPDIAKLAKSQNKKSLVRPTTSCGIFQDCDDNHKNIKLYHQIKIDPKK